MSISIKLLTYVKRHNSTGRPSPDAVGDTYDIVLKEPTSFNNPVIKLDLPAKPTANYCVISDWNAYYFISDIICDNNRIYELHLEIDVLATASAYIKSSSAFVKYSSSNYNENLRDDRILACTDITVLTSENNFTDMVRYANDATYCWCLTTFSKTDGLCSYMLSTNQVRTLTQKLTDDGTSVWGSIEQLFGDAKGSIIACQYVPFKLENLQHAGCVADSTTRIYLGDYDTLVDGYRFNSYCYEITDIISIPSGAYKDFRIASPYQEAKLYVPLVGCIDVALDEFQDRNAIGFQYVVNLANGNVAFALENHAHIISTHAGNCSMSMPLAFQQIASGINAIIGAASIVGGIASGGALTIAGIAGGVASFASSFKKTSTTIGTFSGNFSANMYNKMCLTVFKRSVSEEPANFATLYGRPCGKVLPLSGLTGYVQTCQFALSSPFDEAITNAVNQYLDNGIYLD